jgi:hypothetical protein
MCSYILQYSETDPTNPFNNKTVVDEEFFRFDTERLRTFTSFQYKIYGINKDKDTKVRVDVFSDYLYSDGDYNAEYRNSTIDLTSDTVEQVTHIETQINTLIISKDIVGDSLSFLGIKNRYKTTFHPKTVSDPQSEQAGIQGSFQSLYIDFMVALDTTTLKCQPKLSIFSILSQIGGLLGLTKIFIFVFLYNEKVFENSIRKKYQHLTIQKEATSSERNNRITNPKL